MTYRGPHIRGPVAFCPYCYATVSNPTPIECGTDPEVRMYVDLGAVPDLRVVGAVVVVDEAGDHVNVAGLQAEYVAGRETMGGCQHPFARDYRPGAYHRLVVHDRHERELEPVGRLAAGQPSATVEVDRVAAANAAAAVVRRARAQQQRQHDQHTFGMHVARNRLVRWEAGGLVFAAVC